MKIKNIRAVLNLEELLEEIKAKYFQARMKMEKNNNKKMRKTIAKILTVIKERTLKKD